MYIWSIYLRFCLSFLKCDRVCHRPLQFYLLIPCTFGTDLSIILSGV